MAQRGHLVTLWRRIGRNSKSGPAGFGPMQSPKQERPRRGHIEISDWSEEESGMLWGYLDKLLLNYVKVSF